MIKIGTSGFSFPDWVGTIYPTNIKKGDAPVLRTESVGSDTVD